MKANASLPSHCVTDHSRVIRFETLARNEALVGCKSGNAQRHCPTMNTHLFSRYRRKRQHHAFHARRSLQSFESSSGTNLPFGVHSRIRPLIASQTAMFVPLGGRRYFDPTRSCDRHAFVVQIRSRQELLARTSAAWPAAPAAARAPWPAHRVAARRRSRSARRRWRRALRGRHGRSQC
jgi:hypothetical protein